MSNSVNSTKITPQTVQQSSLTANRINKTNAPDTAEEVEPILDNNNKTELGISQLVRRSQRHKKPIQLLLMTMTTETAIPSEGVSANSMKPLFTEDIPGEMFGMHCNFPDYEDYYNDNPIFALKAASDPDTMYFHEAMN